MRVDEKEPIDFDAPYYRVGSPIMPMALCTLGALALLALLYGFLYDPWYILRWCGYPPADRIEM